MLKAVEVTMNAGSGGVVFCNYKDIDVCVHEFIHNKEYIELDPFTSTEPLPYGIRKVLLTKKQARILAAKLIEISARM